MCIYGSFFLLKSLQQRSQDVLHPPKTREHTASHCNMTPLPATATNTHCNTLQHNTSRTATHCNASPCNYNESRCNSALRIPLQQRPHDVLRHAVHHAKYIWIREIPLKMLHPRNPPNLETRIHRYKFKLNQNLTLNLHRDVPRNLSFSIWWILVVAS